MSRPVQKKLIRIGTAALLVGAVILGGIKRIGAVSSKLMPLMAILYTLRRGDEVIDEGRVKIKFGRVVD